MQKVLYLITKSNFGGAGHYVFDMAKASRDAGFDVVVAAGGSGPLFEKLSAEGVRTLSIPGLERDVKGFKEIGVTNELRRLIRDERPNIIHLNSSKIGALGAIAGRLEKVEKIIYTSHGWAFNEDRSFLWRMAVYYISALTAFLAHTTITISLSEEKDALSFPFINPAKIRMIHNGIGSVALYSREEARGYIERTSGIHFPATVPVYGTIGELHKNKGYMHMLEVCRALKERGASFLYLVIGEGEDLPKLEQYIVQNDLASHVKLLGAIPDKATSSTLLNAFDVFVLPSVKEGLPYVLLEAGVAKLPVVASRVGGIPELIIDGQTGVLSEPKDIISLQNAVERVLHDERLRVRLGVALQEHIATSFSLEKMAQETLFEYTH